MIPYGRQNISTADVDAVVDVLRSDFLTQGPMVPRFETCVADRVGAAHAVAVNSATSALHIACLALGLKPGDLLWTSPITFVASANAGAYCGADIDFVDIDPTTLNLCPLALERKLVQAKAAGRLPKVIIPVHMGGLSCEMDVIAGLAMKARQPSITSPRLCGGMLVAMPTAMPPAPLTSRLGKPAGRTVGSSREPS